MPKAAATLTPYLPMPPQMASPVPAPPQGTPTSCPSLSHRISGTGEPLASHSSESGCPATADTLPWRPSSRMLGDTGGGRERIRQLTPPHPHQGPCQPPCHISAVTGALEDLPVPGGVTATSPRDGHSPGGAQQGPHCCSALQGARVLGASGAATTRPWCHSHPAGSRSEQDPHPNSGFPEAAPHIHQQGEP